MNSMGIRRILVFFHSAFHHATYCVANTFQTKHLLACICLSDFAFFIVKGMCLCMERGKSSAALKVFPQIFFFF